MDKLHYLLYKSLVLANKIQDEKRTREMSISITKIEESQLWLYKLQEKNRIESAKLE